MAMFNSFLYVYQRVSTGGEEQVLLTGDGPVIFFGSRDIVVGSLISA